ncbi:pentatricopeptide repeat-containing protein [Tanacetum coccineum]
MDKVKRANPSAYQYLLDKDPKTWSRTYFHIGTNCEAVENGFSECFNSVLLRVRNKPLITMLEAMRVIVLERMNTMRKLLESWSEDICPNIQKRLEVTKDQHRFWHVIPTGGNLFEVRNGSEAFIVDEKHRTCTCRLWQLSGLPCAYAIAVIFKLYKRAGDYVPVEEDLVNARVDSAPIVDDDYVEAPFLHEQTSQFEVGGLLMVEVKGLRLRLREGELGIEGDLHHLLHLVDWVHGLMLDKTEINFVSPRPRIERIIKKKLANNGIGSLNSNALDSE